MWHFGSMCQEGWLKSRFPVAFGILDIPWYLSIPSKYQEHQVSFTEDVGQWTRSTSLWSEWIIDINLIIAEGILLTNNLTGEKTCITVISIDCNLSYTCVSKWEKWSLSNIWIWECTNTMQSLLIIYLSMNSWSTAGTVQMHQTCHQSCWRYYLRHLSALQYQLRTLT